MEAIQIFSGVARILCQGGHRFGVVKRPKINVYRTTPGSNLYSRICVIVLGLCVIHIVYNKNLCGRDGRIRYAALSACGKVHVCHCNSLGGATYNDNGTDGQADRQTDRRTDKSATQYAAPS